MNTSTKKNTRFAAALAVVLFFGLLTSTNIQAALLNNDFEAGAAPWNLFFQGAVNTSQSFYTVVPFEGSNQARVHGQTTFSGHAGAVGIQQTALFATGIYDISVDIAQHNFTGGSPSGVFFQLLIDNVVVDSNTNSGILVGAFNGKFHGTLSATQMLTAGNHTIGILVGLQATTSIANYIDNVQINLQTTPATLPASMGLLLAGLMAFSRSRQRRRLN